MMIMIMSSRNTNVVEDEENIQGNIKLSNI